MLDLCVRRQSAQSIGLFRTGKRVVVTPEVQHRSRHFNEHVISDLRRSPVTKRTRDGPDLPHQILEGVCFTQQLRIPLEHHVWYRACFYGSLVTDLTEHVSGLGGVRTESVLQYEYRDGHRQQSEHRRQSKNRWARGSAHLNEPPDPVRMRQGEVVGVETAERTGDHIYPLRVEVADNCFNYRGRHHPVVAPPFERIAKPGTGTLEKKTSQAG